MAELKGYKEVIQRIKEYQNVSVVEIRGVLDELGIPTNGQVALEFALNCFIWFGMSEEMAEILQALLRDEEVDIKQTCLLVYFCDGSVPNVPMAKRIPKAGYKKPRWIPVVFNPVQKNTDG